MILFEAHDNNKYKFIIEEIVYYVFTPTVNKGVVTINLPDVALTSKETGRDFWELPDHTLIVDMMDVVGTFDMVVMPIKDSLALDYIASESIGANKIKYDGSLQDLYDNDYPKYVFPQTGFMSGTAGSSVCISAACAQTIRAASSPPRRTQP